jgi:hypothetical protein
VLLDGAVFDLSATDLIQWGGFDFADKRQGGSLSRRA